MATRRARSGEDDDVRRPLRRQPKNESSREELSPLAASLLNKWSWGVLSGNDVQELAAAAKDSGLRGDRNIDLMAAIGTSGQHGQNCHRDLVRIFCGDDLLPPASVQITVPAKVSSQGVIELTAVESAMFYIHDWLTVLSTKPEAMDIALGTVADRRRFWSGVSEDDPRWAHPALAELRRSPDFPAKVVPLLLHGDGAEHKKNDSLTVVSVRSLVATTNTLASQLLVTAFPKSCRQQGRKHHLEDTDTWLSLWRLISWDLQACFEGKRPALDPGGQPAAGAGKSIGIRAVVWVISGDMDYFSNDFWLPHSSANSPCLACTADTDTKPWNDFRPCSLWRSAARDSTPTTHPVASLPGVSLATFCFDALHCLEQGPSSHAIGNLFFEIVVEEFDDRNAGLEYLNERISCLQRERGVEPQNRTPRLELSQFCDAKSLRSSYPCLNKSVKARHVRYLVAVAVTIAEERQHVSREAQHRRAAFQQLAAAYDLIDKEGYFLSQRDAQSLAQGMDRFLAHYSHLAKVAMDAGCKKWSITPKFHFAAHLAAQAKWLSPRCSWTYAGEDFCGRVSSLAHSVLAATPAHRVVPKLLEKYRLASHLRLTRLSNDE
jgi:hypothetical protein